MPSSHSSWKYPFSYSPNFVSFLLIYFIKSTLDIWPSLEVFLCNRGCMFQNKLTLPHPAAIHCLCSVEWDFMSTSSLHDGTLPVLMSHRYEACCLNCCAFILCYCSSRSKNYRFFVIHYHLLFLSLLQWSLRLERRKNDIEVLFMVDHSTVSHSLHLYLLRICVLITIHLKLKLL